MVEGQSMTVADVVAQVRDGRLEDFVREAVVLVARELMEAEISAEIGAELWRGRAGARVDASQRVSPDGRGRPESGRSSCWSRRKRSGEAYFPSFLGAAAALRSRRSSRSCWRPTSTASRTRKVDRLVEQLGDRGNDQGPRLGDVPRAG